MDIKRPPKSKLRKRTRSRRSPLSGAHSLNSNTTRVDALRVRAGTTGRLQQISVHEGQQMTPGINVERLADPPSLKPELKVAEPDH